MVNDFPFPEYPEGGMEKDSEGSEKTSEDVRRTDGVAKGIVAIKNGIHNNQRQIP